MKLFVYKVLAFTSPFILLLLFYLISDPFKVIYNYTTYYDHGEPAYVGLNHDYVTLETFKKNYKKYHYDSFILGNSRSRFYKAEDWKRHIDSDRIFHFDASGESLYGLEKKIEYLDLNNITIKNALIVCDYELFKRINNVPGHLFTKHPTLSGQNYFDFHKAFFKVFSSKSFLRAYIDFKLSNQIKPYMLKNWVFDNVPVSYELKTNELTWAFLEDSIEKHPDSYYSSKNHIFYERAKQSSYEPVIGKIHQGMLRNIFKKFQKDKTNYKMIINPLYNQHQLASEDLKILIAIFGKNNVHDFSGTNSITENKKNFYESSHYRPGVAKMIMDSIYKY